jgi:hypothetical protein
VEFKPLKQFNPPTSFLPRDTKEGELNERSDLNGMNGLNNMARVKRGYAL